MLDFNALFTQAILQDAKTVAHDESGLKKQLVEIGRHESLMREVVLTRTIDNLLCYVSDLLGLVFKFRPEMMKSGEQERLDFILRFEDMDELRAALAEKRVEKLSFMGFRDLADYVREHMGFDLINGNADIERASLLVEMRNIFVHNRGVVGTVSARRFRSLEPLVGRPLSITHDELREERQFVENTVIDMDVRAIAKYGLPAKGVAEPPPHLIGP
ncbi:hypothetical protein D6C00_09850 [Thiohalobacter thiocyanaticus]|uniref:RiboL-PSP-HEPN domain-containing protein n=1 Tax=Thiohalobacter thiocyanaticus TaxID=585455 RepID=A0A426QKC6_9GAMM|nr:hypothetical protein D6C00_09850 [Thiohalobacter thiocyanaticus]